MNTAFIAVLLMSATGALLVLCLALLRPLTKKRFSASWHYHSYMLVVFFLLVPIGAAGGNLPIPNEREMPNVPVIINDMITAPQNNTVPTWQPQDTAPNLNVPVAVETTPAPVFTWNAVLSYVPVIWIGGVILFVLWHGIQLVRFRRSIHRTSLPIEDTSDLLNTAMNGMRIKGNLRLYSNDIIKTPMLVGLFKTRLILPDVEMSERELAVILKHELVHFKRRDLWVKSLALFANSIHWFNPAAYRLTKQLGVYCEMSCDERVVADMSAEERRFYGETILNVLSRSTEKYSGIYATLAESQKGVKRRLTHMMGVKKSSKHIVIVSLIAAVVLCLTGFAAASVMNMQGDVEPEGSEVLETMLPSVSDNAMLSAELFESAPLSESSDIGVFLKGTWKVKKFLGFTAITKDDIEWPDGEKIVDKTVYISNSIFSTEDFGSEYDRYAVNIQLPIYTSYNEKGYDFSKHLSPAADASIRELDHENILNINVTSSDGLKTGPQLLLIDNSRLLISLNCDYFELERISDALESIKTETITLEGIDEEIQTKLYVGDSWSLYYDFVSYNVDDDGNKTIIYPNNDPDMKYAYATIEHIANVSVEDELHRRTEEAAKTYTEVTRYDETDEFYAVHDDGKSGWSLDDYLLSVQLISDGTGGCYVLSKWHVMEASEGHGVRLSHMFNSFTPAPQNNSAISPADDVEAELAKYDDGLLVIFTHDFITAVEAKDESVIEKYFTSPFALISEDGYMWIDGGSEDSAKYTLFAYDSEYTVRLRNYSIESASDVLLHFEGTRTRPDGSGGIVFYNVRITQSGTSCVVSSYETDI